MRVRVWVRRSKTGLSSHRVSDLMRVGGSKRGLSQRVSLEVSSDACTGRGSQYHFCINLYFCLVIFCICILVLFLAKKYIYGGKCIL